MYKVDVNTGKHSLQIHLSTDELVASLSLMDMPGVVL
jgi:hypothetical protein